jgi:ankyrin repeat protein
MWLNRCPQWWLVAMGAVVSLGAAPAVPIVDAVRSGDREAVRALIAASADVNAATADGATALHWAVHLDDLETVDLLIRAGARVTVPNRYGVPPLALAAENGNPLIIERLLRAGADPNGAQPEGETVLMTAARTGSAAALRLLIARGAAVDARDEVHGQTALMWAAARNNAEAIRVLLEAGADLHARTDGTRPAAGRSVFGSSRQPATSFSALLFAVRGGHLEAVKVLLDAGASVNDALSDGNSALVVAAANAHWQLADFLLDRGADPNHAGAGWNALHQIVRTRRVNIGGAPGPVVTGSVDSLDVIRKMIARGVKLDARMSVNGMKDGQRVRVNRLGATAFFLAAKSTDVDAMRVLVAAGANPHIPAADGTTALMVAAGLQLWIPGEDGGSLPSQAAEQLEAVRMCLDLGLDVNAVNDRGETPLHGAAYRGVNAIVQHLVDHGANLEARDEHGWSALAIARGLTYTDFYKEQPHTAALLSRLMDARNISTDGHVVESIACYDCFQTRPEQARAVLERDERMEAAFAAGEYDWQSTAPHGRRPR